MISGKGEQRFTSVSTFFQSNLNDECYFLEKLEENHYNTYMSQKYQDQGWYVGIKKNGRPKAGPRTHMGQKAVYFLPRIIDNTSK